MVLLAAVVMPHGVMPFDGDEQSPSQAVRERRSRLDAGFRDTLSQVSANNLVLDCDRKKAAMSNIH